MKLSFSVKKQEAKFEADVEGIIKKKMEIDSKNEAKIDKKAEKKAEEIIQKMEKEGQAVDADGEKKHLPVLQKQEKPEKKTRLQIREEKKRITAEMKHRQKMEKEAAEQKRFLQGMGLMIGLLVFFMIIVFLNT